jgi:DNA-binding beta-propeller fold protein YncE
MKLPNLAPLFLFAITSSSQLLAHISTEHPPGNAPQHTLTTGVSAYSYQVVPHWGELPDGKLIGPTHGGVVVDPQSGLIYVSTNAAQSILVYQPDGTLVNSIAPQCRGFHAMDLAVENGQTVLYGAQLDKSNPRLCKLNTEGTILMEISATTNPELPGGWKGITGVAVAPDGSIFCSMGYGSNLIHKFTSEGDYQKSFGGKGDGEAVLTNTSHGLKVDTRFEPARLLVCDRENRRLFHASLAGEWIGEITTDLRRPCSVSLYGDLCAIAELEGRVTLIDIEGRILAHLGDNPDQKQWAKFNLDPQAIAADVFTAPHGLSFDSEGNLYVQDWNKSGRVTKLIRQ